MAGKHSSGGLLNAEKEYVVISQDSIGSGKKQAFPGNGSKIKDIRATYSISQNLIEMMMGNMKICSGVVVLNTKRVLKEKKRPE